MLSSEQLKQAKLLEIKTRQLVQSTFSGEYHSAFKGQGISFAQVRPYQVGDDVRRIDWNVTAKTGEPFIKEYEESRELTVFLAVDVSASGVFGHDQQQKIEMIQEIATVLGFSAISNQDKVGLLLFSDQVERFVPPKKGRKHMFRLLQELLKSEPEGTGTSLNTALEYLYHMSRKKSIIFVLSDFHDEGYDTSFKLLSQKHEVIPIIVRDQAEYSLPDLGRILVADSENGQRMVIDTSSPKVKDKYNNMMLARQLADDRLFRSVGCDPVKVMTGTSYIQPLMRYFEGRVR